MADERRVRKPSASTPKPAAAQCRPELRILRAPGAHVLAGDGIGQPLNFGLAELDAPPWDMVRIRHVFWMTFTSGRGIMNSPPL